MIGLFPENSTRLTPLLLIWKVMFGLKIQPNAWGNYWILYHKTNKEASTVLCSVVKHLGRSRALKKWGKTLDYVSCFLLHFFRALPLPACLTEQNRAQSRLLYLLIKSLKDKEGIELIS